MNFHSVKWKQNCLSGVGIIKRKSCFWMHLRTGLQRHWWEACCKQRDCVGVRESRTRFPSPRKGASFLPLNSHPPLALLLLNCSLTILRFSAYQWASSIQREERHRCWDLRSELELYSIIQREQKQPSTRTERTCSVPSLHCHPMRVCSFIHTIKTIF